ncbi:DgyrCDS10568 [Dimorphilus gyrociliatus]|uniref:von Willebrand factor A domain-containing protein 8 n=1 Tax=Dimorphilus gyrociliatus TaxID=2664684 RepID=A0A7I8W0L1_9ANNE|nr:DgyrCDS10568 [Dimorphilus gyrociliatus]
MSRETASRRISNLRHILDRSQAISGIKFFCSSSGNEFVSIGDVSVKTENPKNPALVPIKYIPEGKIPQSLLQHLRWIMQKDVLGQDIFLIGAPGPLRRSVAMMYLELTLREAEYISLSRDTTDSDLKQRREIQSGTSHHIDQCAVRAATEGRVLILEGIEKAERNVLPVLNNLLENREMQLDDGRFLMSAERYDKLLKDHSKEELDSWNLVRVSEKFRVIALGLPVPRYTGNPLDPPLRSRFQARDVPTVPYQEHLTMLKDVGKDLLPEKLNQVLSFASTLRTEESRQLSLPDFPIDNIHKIVDIMKDVPIANVQRLLELMYPYHILLTKEGKTAVEDSLKTFNLKQELEPSMFISEISRKGNEAEVTVMQNRTSATFKVKSGTNNEQRLIEEFVATGYHDNMLAEMMLSHKVHDLCIVGPRGCGKSIVVNQFANMLGYNVEHIMLYQDMSARDLLQQRTTTQSGDTIWQPSALVTAAREGSLVVLDGVHRANAGTFAVLQRLIHDRELSLFDGTKLMGHDRYNELKSKHSLTDEELANRNVFPIHPSFRIVALSEPPSSANQQNWLTSEMLTMFLYHTMDGLTKFDEQHIINKLVPKAEGLDPILQVTHKLRESTDSNLKSIATSLSTRQLLRIAKRLYTYPGDNVYDVVQKACLAKFLPRLTRTALEEELERMNIAKKQVITGVENIENSITCGIKNGVLRIGNTTVDINQTDAKMKVPDVLFYENPQHLMVMEDMLKDYLLGEHLLLVGNQGVGKNKIIDRFLSLLNRPREYIQLHRDTTIQTLTLQPTVVDGVIKFEDSPLVKAVKKGYVLVVDEADKAPTNVTCILKTLVENGEMHLSDGRRIVNANSSLEPSEKIIKSHPDFRMMVLANRPGFPFLGNDFFGAMGDIFSAHAIDNPDVTSEMEMLRQYGPQVPEHILKKLVLAFGELRTMADEGQINYPYSTREVVNMVKHLQKYPNEGLSSVVQNVFDFDSYNKELKETVVETMHKHGVPIGANPNNIKLAKTINLPDFVNIGKIQLIRSPEASVCSVEDKKFRVKGTVRNALQNFPLEKTEARSILFSEQESHWTLPLHETSAVVDVAVTKAQMRSPVQDKKSLEDIIHVITANPISLYSMNASKQHLTCIDLYNFFPTTKVSSRFKPKITIIPLSSPLDYSIVLHEEETNTTLLINYENGDVSKLETQTMLESAAQKVTKNFRSYQGLYRICGDFTHETHQILIYKKNESKIEVIDLLQGICHCVTLPGKISNLHMPSRYDWLINDDENNKRYLISHTKENPYEYTIQTLSEANSDLEMIVAEMDRVSNSPMHSTHLSHVLNEQIESPNRVLMNSQTYASIAVGFPELSSSDIYTIPRKVDNTANEYFKKLVSGKAKGTPVAYLPNTSQVVRLMPTYGVPEEAGVTRESARYLSGYLEVTDPLNKKIRYLPIPGVSNYSVYNQWFVRDSDVDIIMSPTSNDGIVTVDGGGCVRLWETSIAHLDSSLGSWRQMIGSMDFENLQITRGKDGPQPPMDFSGPKHGRVDPSNAPHVGGNQWAGGSGGRDTAGMGGGGGPYRLDSGHDVTQIPDWQKMNIPPEVLLAAREMGLKAWKERLKQIEMSEYDGEMYDRFSQAVQRQVQSLRVILENLQAKGKERQWLKHQSHGDLDETKLIEGLAGEKSIYKRRGEKEPEMGTPQQKPKLLRLVVDVSGSMYRFNGYDGRLERSLEACLMVMEALENFEHKVKFEIVGHSGEGPSFDMLKKDKLPKNNKERLNVLKTMHAHSQFCISGDHTIEATEEAIKKIKEEEADEHFVIVLSDANLDRYGIRPKHLTEVLTMDEEVNSYIIFIGSLGNQAQSLVKQLPSGRGFLCMETKNLPQILQQIFTSTMLAT